MDYSRRIATKLVYAINWVEIQWFVDNYVDDVPEWTVYSTGISGKYYNNRVARLHHQ